MACNSCAKSFSLFRKEKGCPGCGFSYCSKCLNDIKFVRKLNAEAKVCAKCKRRVSTSDEQVIPPPDAYFKRIEALDNNPDKTFTSNPKDLHILERLQKLKAESKAGGSKSTEDEIKERLQNIKGKPATASDSEIQERLAKLRGVPVEVLNSKPKLPPPNTRTDQEQIDDLMKQYMEQTKMDNNYQDEFDALVSDMEARMQKLKGSEPHGTPEIPKHEKSESEDEEEAVKNIVQKVKAEACLEDDLPPSTNDELPFCEICNEDARMRCLGCRYLFCKQCFLEHKDDDDGCDRYEPYQPPTEHKL